ncbi:hypothetical protein J4217_03725 [Candidatus Pacearchaeota archaeon]|nr:hypothetical protein [uncultured archaeon]AQS33251.1 hypothetical protein [uncultured archaeon]MBS3091528.1 hypothetical protein [Candidatus Pacearchaeota archaeon]
MNMEEVLAAISEKIDAGEYTEAKTIVDDFYTEKNRELCAMQRLAANEETRFSDTIPEYVEMLEDLAATSNRIGDIIRQTQNTSGGQN